MMSAQTINEQYSQIHNGDVDVILNLLPKSDVATYYSKHADERIAKHLELYKQSNSDRTYRFFVEAIHALPDVDGTTFSKEELQRAAKTLSFRPINIDHNPKYGQGKHLPYPTNSTLWMSYDPLLEAVTGLIQLDFAYAQAVRERRISGLSVEYFSLGGSDGKGIVFTALALVSSSKTPADKKTRIYREVSNSQ